MTLRRRTGSVPSPSQLLPAADCSCSNSSSSSSALQWLDNVVSVVGGRALIIHRSAARPGPARPAARQQPALRQRADGDNVSSSVLRDKIESLRYLRVFVFYFLSLQTDSSRLVWAIRRG